MALNRQAEAFTHHAYGIAGNFAAVFPELRASLAKEQGVALTGNPDAYVRDVSSLSVEDAREVKDFAGTRSIGAGPKVVVLGFVDATRQAQNALLKTLEEPNEGVRFFIITPVLETLLPTLRSRLLLQAGSQGVAYQEEARAFLHASPAKRVLLLKPFLGEEKDRTGALSFIAALEREVRGAPEKPLEGTHAAALGTLEQAIRDLRLTGASVKMVLEHVALVL